ncbi:outer membrane protein [Halocynthiibacter sp.]|uniref:outer membrane protein n=1 Tax=Halocynthiibacter sp. TaxID=1979210 RepID=UPI003C5BECB8
MTTAALTALTLSSLPILAQDKPHNWQGAYAGVSIGLSSGSSVVNLGGTPAHTSLDDSRSVGVFAGYNFHLHNNIVLGAEISHRSEQSTLTVGPGIALGASTMVQARVGYAMDNWLLYGVVGSSRADMAGHAIPGSFTTKGIVYGIGADYAVSDHFILGAKFTREEPDFAFGGTTAFDSKRDSLELRASYQF